MIRSVSVAALVLAVLNTQSSAGERKLFENVKGWEVEQNVDKPGQQSCQIAYSYKDKDDKDAENAVVAALDGQKLNLVLGYENWEWDADEKVTAPIRADKQMLFSKQGWVGSGKILSTQLPDSVIAKLVKAKQIVLEMGDGTADFDIPNLADAIDAMKRCNAAFDPAAAPAKTAAPATTEERAFAYGAGLSLRKMVGACEISTTAKQRAALDAKIAALKPEMTAYEAEIQADLAKPGTAPCPTSPVGIETVEFGIKSFAELSPEAFTAAFKGRLAENEARAKAEAEAKARAETEARMRAEIEAKMRAEAEARSKADAEAKARAEMEARIRSEVEAKLRAEAEAKARADAAKIEVKNEAEAKVEAKVPDAKP